MVVHLLKGSLFYSNYTLEHVMPQTWSDFWSIKALPVIDLATNMVIMDEEEAALARTAAVYEIGNMALLTGSLNSSISNFEMERKINGDPNGRMRNKAGIRQYASLATTLEVVNEYDNNQTWNEGLIRRRTEELSDKIVKIWPQ